MPGPTWLGAVLFLGVQLRGVFSSEKSNSSAVGSIPVQEYVAVFATTTPALWPVAAIEVYTSKEVDAVNGTNLRLKCTFSSSSPISPLLSVTWNFQPEDLSSHEPVFYYLKEPYTPSAGRFKGRVTWDGNIERYDVSIMLWNLQPTDNGTYTCQVKNPRDIDGTIGEVRLRVVQKVNFSEIHFLAIAIGSACGLMIIVVTVVIICRHHRKKQQEKTIEVADTELRREKEKLKNIEEKEITPLED